jgi:hypothetical protein
VFRKAIEGSNAKHDDARLIVAEIFVECSVSSRSESEREFKIGRFHNKMHAIYFNKIGSSINNSEIGVISKLNKLKTPITRKISTRKSESIFRYSNDFHIHMIDS